MRKDIQVQVGLGVSIFLMTNRLLCFTLLRGSRGEIRSSDHLVRPYVRRPDGDVIISLCM